MMSDEMMSDEEFIQNASDVFQQVIEADTRNFLELAQLAGLDIKKDLAGANLSRFDLRNADLRNADLRNADLRGTDLRDADLRNANLRGADLRNANRRGANLRGADLRGAKLNPSIFGKIKSAIPPHIEPISLPKIQIRPHLFSFSGLQIANVFVAFTALVHINLFVVEMFVWKEPVIHQRLGFSLDEALKVAPIVANAGLYNGFLAAGLIWGLVSGRRSDAIKVFCLVCVIIAGIFGAATLTRTPLLIQTAPSAIALSLLWISKSQAKKHLGTQDVPSS
jgi:putative membrane protein